MYTALVNYKKTEELIRYLEFKSDYDDSNLDRLNELKRKQKDLVYIVDQFSEPRRSIIRRKYFEGETLENIAIDSGYSTSHIRLVHTQTRQILEELELFIKI